MERKLQELHPGGRMKLSKLPLVATLSLAATLIVACGDDKPDPSKALNAADVMYLKQERLQKMYGSTITQTSTKTETVIVNTTVNASGGNGSAQ